jgi:hypothetical protein
MRLFTVALTSIFVIGCFHGPPPWDPESLISRAAKSDLRVAAMADLGGPAGKSWYLQIVNSDLYLEFFDGSTGGQYKKHVKLSERRLRDIKDAFASSGLFTLSTYVVDHPCYEDGVTLFLDAALGGKKTSLELCEPNLALKYPEAKRFLAMWNAVFADFDNHPKW